MARFLILPNEEVAHFLILPNEEVAHFLILPNEVEAKFLNWSWEGGGTVYLGSPQISENWQYLKFGVPFPIFNLSIFGPFFEGVSKREEQTFKSCM